MRHPTQYAAVEYTWHCLAYMLIHVHMPARTAAKVEKKDGIETGNGGNAIMTVPVHATAPCVC
jgi:hypothetical protein